jgi:transposase
MKKRGRPPKHSKEQLEAMREGVNNLYWTTSCSIARISRQYGISPKLVNELLIPKAEHLREDA